MTHATYFQRFTSMLQSTLSSWWVFLRFSNILNLVSFMLFACSIQGFQLLIFLLLILILRISLRPFCSSSLENLITIQHTKTTFYQLQGTIFCHSLGFGLIVRQVSPGPSLTSIFTWFHILDFFSLSH